ncbi:uncharacterized protein LOC115629886 [Scaptodrosophila lebanonensis]|uniref:Uncharacterized protein LOC115629886 n=1 Tax=Drosophila lebanonensis TaxID=7225 RepID=A0A6J2U389_DROLE|nr:uncharacterized protein LOC115629886 [Scaptodrosophila lebanonensis]
MRAMGATFGGLRHDVQANKHKSRPKKATSVLNAIEDIQRLTPENMHQEFDRLLKDAHSHAMSLEANSPCSDAADTLKRCLHQNREHNCKCFSAMESYQSCVIKATQDRVDELAKHSPPTSELLQPRINDMPTPELPAATGRQRHRCWWKPWTWLR